MTEQTLLDSDYDFRDQQRFDIFEILLSDGQITRAVDSAQLSKNASQLRMTLRMHVKHDRLKYNLYIKNHPMQLISVKQPMKFSDGNGGMRNVLQIKSVSHNQALSAMG